MAPITASALPKKVADPTDPSEAIIAVPASATSPEGEIREDRHKDRLGAHYHHARRHARVVE